MDRKALLTQWIIRLLILAAIAFVVYVRNKPPEADTHFHAGFTVFVDGVRQDFAKSQYMHVDPCGIHERNNSGTPSAADRIHLHNNIGNVAHIHARGVLWKELFAGIGISMPKSNVVTYRNGERVYGMMNEEVRMDDSVIFVFGKTVSLNASDFVTRKQIRNAERLTESCN